RLFVSRSKSVVQEQNGPSALLCPVEIMFIVDSSEKAKAELYERQKEFILRFSTRLMQLHPVGWRLRMRLAALQYSSTVTVEHNFRDWQDLDVFQSRVAAMTFIGHGTYSAYAIYNATEVFRRETSSSSLRVVLLMTDGADHPRSPSVVRAAAEAKQRNIRVFTIRLTGLTKDDPMGTKLRSIASAPPQKHVLSLTDSHLEDRLFNELVSYGDKGNNGRPGPPGPVGLGLSILLLLPCALLQGDRGYEGPKGSRGLPGLGSKGDKGNPGAPGLPGLVGFPGAGIQGEKGDQGPTGPSGVRGPPGLGIIGPKGDQGFPGETGPQGVRGVGEPGPKGEPGPDGAAGIPGIPGEDGAAGHKVSQCLKVNGHVLENDMQVNALCVILLTLVQGEPGSPGLVGVPGLAGRGLPGSKVMRYNQLFAHHVCPHLEQPKGCCGYFKLTIWLPFISYNLCYCGNKGNLGPVGPPGMKGDGFPGPQGLFGLPGAQGEVGPEGKGLPGPKVRHILIFTRMQGDRGIPGDRGKKGDQGDYGEPGSTGPMGLAFSFFFFKGLLYFVICCPGCGLKCRESPLELVFVIDSSESVGPENFELVKDFVNALLDRISVSRDATQIGVVLYSHKNMVVVSLQQESRQDDIKTAVKRMPYLGEGTFTGSAIHRANQLFQAARPGVRKVAVVLTDGQADPREVMQFEEMAAEAHANGIEMFVIGIVNKTDPLFEAFQAEMNVIASDPDEEHVYLIDDFRTLPSDLSTCGNPPRGPRGRAHTSNIPLMWKDRFNTRKLLTSHITFLVIPVKACSKSLDPGPCRQYVVKWYYDPEANTCAQFWFGGCQGNTNNFETEANCRNSCIFM
uniref:Collagen type XXVIII alpha 1 chain n=1 Tax=Echeneis naucrates TaxID=173247 RepID=A0A665WII7_ECHNA